MTEIIFAKPVYQYDSYSDFWRLVKLSNFPIISVDKIDITQDYTIITAPMNGDYKEHINAQIKRQIKSGLPRLSHLIVWNLERPAGSGSTGQYAKECFEWMSTRLVDEVWVSDPSLADEACLRFVILGSDCGLGEVSEEKKYDFAHMSVTNPRRVQILKSFGESNVGPNCWPPERDQVLRSSRFGLNIHQDNYPFCEPLRLALFAAYGLPVVSEILRNSYPYNGDIQQFPYHNLVDGLKSVLNNDYTKWKEMGLRLRKKLCEDLQFGKMVRRAVEESVGWR